MKLLNLLADEPIARLIYQETTDPVVEAEADEVAELSEQETLEAALWAASRNPEGAEEAAALDALIEAQVARLFDSETQVPIISAEALNLFLAANYTSPLEQADIAGIADDIEGSVGGVGIESEAITPEETAELRDMPNEVFLEMPRSERLRFITAQNVTADQVASGSVTSLAFTFTFDGQFNPALQRLTTAGQVLPAEVRSVTSSGEVFSRSEDSLHGEFFTESGVRLLIIEGTQLTNIETDAEAIANVQTQIDQRLVTFETVEEGEDARTEGESLVARMALERNVAPEFVMGAFVAGNPIETEDLGISAEQVLTLAYRAQLENFLTDIDRSEEMFRQNYSEIVPRELERLSPEFAAFFLSRGRETSEVTTIMESLGYSADEIERADEVVMASPTVGLGAFENVDLMSEPGFSERLAEVAANIGTTPGNLMQIFRFETGGTFNPAETNSIGATGLIQFMPQTAAGLGTSTAALRRMTGTEQLDWVERYYAQYASRGLDGVEDLYLATLYPYALGRSDNFVLGSERSASFARTVGRQNPVFNNGGLVTVGHVRRSILAH
jgi:hypothetical protein